MFASTAVGLEEFAPVPGQLEFVGLVGFGLQETMSRMNCIQRRA